MPETQQPTVHTQPEGNWKMTLIRAGRAALITFLSLFVPAILACIAPPYELAAMRGCLEGVFSHFTLYFAPAVAGLIRGTYGIAVYHLNNGNGVTLIK